MENHPISEIFPLMADGPEWDNFVESIKQNGLRHPILLHRDGRILDGRNRYRACTQVGVPCRTETFEGTDDEAIDLIVDENKHRRHLTQAQLAMVAVRIATMKSGARTDLLSAERRLGVSQAAAAKQTGATVGSMARANVVLKSGNEELIREVEQGKISLRKAAEQVTGKPAEKRRWGTADVWKEEKRKFQEQNGKLLAIVQDLPAGKMPEPRKPKAPQDILPFMRRITRVIGNLLRGELYFKAIIKNKDALAEDVRRETALTLRNFARELQGFADELYTEGEGHVEVYGIVG